MFLYCLNVKITPPALPSRDFPDKEQPFPGGQITMKVVATDTQEGEQKKSYNAERDLFSPFCNFQFSAGGCARERARGQIALWNFHAEFSLL